jgi:hypothetical protein
MPVLFVRRKVAKEIHSCLDSVGGAETFEKQENDGTES